MRCCDLPSLGWNVLDWRCEPCMSCRINRPVPHPRARRVLAKKVVALPVLRRPDWPGHEPRPEGRTISISPAFTTKNGTSVWPSSINTSPRVIGRITPWEAIRAICAELSVGNMSAASGALVRGVERVVSVTSSLALDGMCERNVDTPDFAFDGHAVRLEGILCRASQHGSRPNVELRTRQGAGHRRAVECVFTQWILPVPTRDRAHVNRLTNSSAFSATSRQPPSIVNACPRPGILTISVTPLLRFCFL
jgi:hypothetical protein